MIGGGFIVEKGHLVMRGLYLVQVFPIAIFIFFIFGTTHIHAWGHLPSC
jgi:hypothetical protein